MLPVDQREGMTVTTRPGGERLELAIRAVDVANSRALAEMEGIHVLSGPEAIADAIRECSRRRSEKQ